MSQSFTVRGLSKPTRLDRVLRDHFPQWGRQAVQKLISGKAVTVNGRAVWLASWEIGNGDTIAVKEAPAAKPEGPARFEDAWLLAQENDLIVVNKPAGLLAESPRWRAATNLLDLATARFGPLVLFHRLDRDTSGVILLTRPGPINQYLDQAFKQHAVRKEYVAVVRAPNRLAATGVIDARLAPDPQRRDKMVVVARGGQRAVTRYAVECSVGDKQFVRLWPETGRTHQLRVHLAHLGAPIVGDRLYGSPPAADQRLMLHAYQISLPAADDQIARVYVAPLPDEF
jgi:23S rRNA pseudouridine1911/1915/1917 synthase